MLYNGFDCFNSKKKGENDWSKNIYQISTLILFNSNLTATKSIESARHPSIYVLNWSSIFIWFQATSLYHLLLPWEGEKRVVHYNSVFRRFRQMKFAYGGSILSSSQFLLLPLWPLITTVTIKVVKIDLKIITLLP